MNQFYNIRTDFFHNRMFFFSNLPGSFDLTFDWPTKAKNDPFFAKLLCLIFAK